MSTPHLHWHERGQRREHPPRPAPTRPASASRAEPVVNVRSRSARDATSRAKRDWRKALLELRDACARSAAAYRDAATLLSTDGRGEDARVHQRATSRAAFEYVLRAQLHVHGVLVAGPHPTWTLRRALVRALFAIVPYPEVPALRACAHADADLGAAYERAVSGGAFADAPVALRAIVLRQWQALRAERAQDRRERRAREHRDDAENRAAGAGFRGEGRETLKQRIAKGP